MFPVKRVGKNKSKVVVTARPAPMEEEGETPAPSHSILFGIPPLHVDQAAAAEENRPRQPPTRGREDPRPEPFEVRKKVVGTPQYMLRSDLTPGMRTEYVTPENYHYSRESGVFDDSLEETARMNQYTARERQKLNSTDLRDLYEGSLLRGQLRPTHRDST